VTGVRTSGRSRSFRVFNKTEQNDRAYMPRVCLARTPRLCQVILQVLYDLPPIQIPASPPIRTSQATPYSRETMNSISMDFIEKLPTSSGYNAILVIVDRLSKQGIFIPTTVNITSPMLAQLFVLHVFSKHGVPSHVTSDRGSKFVSHFFRSLGEALDM